ncbi:MAG: ABC transporter ATP-binding protein [Planctomycetaceae bacterium]|nr:ABC transporter ATP-binding protein [Planctomycetaceae bacterium]
MIELRDVCLQAGKFRLEHLSLQVNVGEYVVLMGRSGQGKTTILETICGLRPVESGTILIHGTDVSHWKPAQRGIGFVPQDHVLFPTMTVQQQLEFPLELRGTKLAERKRRIDELARVLDLSHLLARFPKGLSGGEAQRVAIGRALSFEPAVLLLDEPLSSLDDDLRRELHQLLKTVRQNTNAAILHVTHNEDDARALADRILVLSNGRITSTQDSAAFAQGKRNE